ncbi:hypothetical protein [Marilutibacter maris]|uniref:hypothetical protein n=1 Tax=Marilutibacter maris TaxID=1605891 RepID=UPI000DA9AAD8|nr:hypothetical protein [Lysobacter maris]
MLRLSSGEVLMIGSPSPDALLTELAASAAQIGTGTLGGARIYLALDDERFAQARDALAASGARILQLDPATPIAQHPEHIARLQEHEAPGGGERDICAPL